MSIGRNIFKRLVSGYRITSKRYAEEIFEHARLPEATQQMFQPQITMPPVRVQPQITMPPIQMQPQITVQAPPPQVVSQPILIPVQPQQKQQPPMEIRGELITRPLEKKIKIEGLDIPTFSPTKVRISRIQPVEEKKIFAAKYSLIPKKPAKNEPIFAYANIYWDAEMNKYVYNVTEPPMSSEMKDLLKKIKELLEQKLDVDFSKLKKFEAKDYLRKNIDEILSYYEFKLSEKERQTIYYYIERDFTGLGRIEPMMNDENIEDISCDGVGVPLFVFHRDPNLGSLITNITFDDQNELDSFLVRLSQLCGKSISVASPLLDGTLPDGSRLQATLATDIARRGSNFTIRRFTENPLTPVHLLNYETLDVKTMAFLWLAVDFGKSILVSGGTASGKTSLLNVLSMFIRPEKKIVSIEDTSELKLPHPHWVPHIARTAMVAEEGRRVGEVDMFDLLKESLRQRPDQIIVGEVRGKEAFVLFQEMSTGHPSLATIHAENMPKLADRLTTPPINLPAGLIGSLDLIVFLLRMKYKDKHVRRVNEILEVVGVDEGSRLPITNRVFKWNAINDSFETVGTSVLLKKISEGTGMTEQQIKDELERRMLVLNWMQENNITDYRDVHKVISVYYHYPERILSSIMGGI